MKRELLTPVALAVGTMVAAVACTADDADPVSTGGADPIGSEPPATTGTPTTLPTAGGDDPTPPVRPQAFGSGRLGFFGDCPALLDYMQAEASARVTPWGLDGGYYYDDRLFVEEGTVVDVAADEPASAPAVEADFNAGGGVPGVDFSGTNTQEVGVDEGDIVETDGEYVYVASTDGLRIVSVADARVVSEPRLPDGSHQLLLDGSRLLVVTSSWTGSADTIVSLYDVSDPTSATLLRRSHLEGQILATRSVDGVARLVISASFAQRLPFVQPNEFGLDEERALERNREIIEESSVEDWLPRWFDEAGDGSFDAMQPALDCNDVAAPRDFAGLGLTWIASVDMQGAAVPTGSAGIVSTGQTVYASTDNLYIATQNWDWQFGRWEVVVDEQGQETEVDPGPPPTLIHQFALGAGTDATYVASGEVEGRLLNQFAMSEHNGDLRVASTIEDWRFGNESESQVTVLRPNGDELEVISTIGGLGFGEQIFAIRFMGDTAYVVTFRQIDPLYVIDLSDPANPVLNGELKIPGYSAYLHPVGEGLLLGVGQDATEEGGVLGTQLSLFDVSNPQDPQRIDTLSIGGYSEVEWDHKAFLFWQPDGTIVLPVSPGWGDCGPNDDCIADGITGAAGAVVASLDGRELSSRGVINHEFDEQFNCWNPLQRSIAIGDELVTVGLDQMKFSDRQTLDGRASVTWGQPGQYGCYWYWGG